MRSTITKRPDENKAKSDKAVETVKSFLSGQGYTCTDVTRIKQGLRRGFDILAKRRLSSLKIEIKGSSKEDGIPDCYWKEFDSKKRLIADYVYIVRLNRASKPKRMEVLSKKEVDTYAAEHMLLRRIRIAARLKTDLKNQKIGRIIPVSQIGGRTKKH